MPPIMGIPLAVEVEVFVLIPLPDVVEVVATPGAPAVSPCPPVCELPGVLNPTPPRVGTGDAFPLPPLLPGTPPLPPPGDLPPPGRSGSGGIPVPAPFLLALPMPSPEFPPVKGGFTEPPPGTNAGPEPPPVNDGFKEPPPPVANFPRPPPGVDDFPEPPLVNDGLTEPPLVNDGLAEPPPVNDGLAEPPPGIAPEPPPLALPLAPVSDGLFAEPPGFPGVPAPGAFGEAPEGLPFVPRVPICVLAVLRAAVIDWYACARFAAICGVARSRTLATFDIQTSFDAFSICCQNAGSSNLPEIV